MKRCLVALLSVVPLMSQGSTDVAEPLVNLEHLAPTVEQFHSRRQVLEVHQWLGHIG